MVPVGVVQVEVLGLHGRRQDDVGVERRVGQPLLEDDREEVLAREAGVHARVIGIAGRRVGVEDDSAATGGSSVCVSASPRRDMLIVRAGGAGRCGGHRDAAGVDAAEVAAGHARGAPPPTWRKSPVRPAARGSRAPPTGAAVPLQPEADA